MEHINYDIACDVCSCKHNHDGCNCMLDHIMVGCSADNKSCTCCESFDEKE